jgi:hypothetical protein
MSVYLRLSCFSWNLLASNHRVVTIVCHQLTALIYGSSNISNSSSCITLRLLILFKSIRHGNSMSNKWLATNPNLTRLILPFQHSSSLTLHLVHRKGS